MEEIKFEDIKPIGNFDTVLTLFRKRVDNIIEACNAEQKYLSGVAKEIKIIVGEFAIIDVLEKGLIKNDCWDRREAMICLLYTHLLIIDLNDVAQKYLNKINMPTRISQLQEYVDEKPEIFEGLKL